MFLSHQLIMKNQPCHLKLTDASIPISNNFEHYDSPEQRYCPAGL